MRSLSRSLTFAALGVLSCSTHDSLLESHGGGGSGANSATTTSGGAAGSGETAGSGGDGASSGGATTGSGGRVITGAGGAPSGASGSGGIIGTSAGGALPATGGTSNQGSGGANAPAVDGGVVRTLHIVTPSVATPPGSEVHRCYHARLPSSTNVQAVAFRSHARGLNELMIYRATADSAKDGTLDTTSCTLGQASWTYAAWAEDYDLTMPSGVAEELVAHQPLLLDMHFVNTGAGEVTSSLSLDIDVAEGTFEQAAAIVSFNTSIHIPSKGVQTVSGDCTTPPDMKLFSMTTHTNRLATDSSVVRKLQNGQLGDAIVHTSGAASPAIAEWTAPPFVTLLPGEKLHYQCSYKNDGTSAITVGTSALSNELCMMIGYFFPAAPVGACN
jgi:hypothetical protein